MSVYGLALCAGYGGIELGLELVIPSYRAVGYVEREARAAATLVARMEEAALAPAPVWDDITTFDGGPWRGRVDILSAGIPCQPWSQAGLRRGLEDERHLWPHVERIVQETDPAVLFVENVAGFRRVGLPAVLQSVTDLGFDSEWGLFSAQAVGAPHRRARYFLLAYADRDRLARISSGRLLDQERSSQRHDTHGRSSDVADTNCQPRRHKSRRCSRTHGQGTSEHRDDGSALDIFPPGPDDDRWQAVSEDLQPPLSRLADGPPALVDECSPADRLRLSGGGVVPLAAACAWSVLSARAVRTGNLITTKNQTT